MLPVIASACLLLVLCSPLTSGDVTTTAGDPVAALKIIADQAAAQLNNLTSQIAKYEADLAAKDAKIAQLNQTIEHDDQLIASLKQRIIAQAQNLTAVDTYCHTQATRLASELYNLEHPVGFTSHYTNDSTEETSGDNVLHFDTVQSSAGGDVYNDTTGLFTAPSSGTYVFFLTIQRNNPTEDSCLKVNLMKNINKYFGCSAAACPPGFTTNTVTCFTHLAAGETVEAKTDAADDIFGYIHTTFSAMKV